MRASCALHSDRTMAEAMDVLGSTFEEVAHACGAKPHTIKQLRAAYRSLLSGLDGDGELQADVLPIVRQRNEGELIKFVQRTHDDLEIESVLVPMRRRGRDWKTLCVSSQIGCARGCAFCETAQLGLLRNLTAGEIVGQVVAAQREFGGTVRNVVFMGMGEPLDNFDNLVQAIRVLFDRAGLSFAQERIRISTVGRTAGIQKLAALGWRRIDVAVSLNAPNDAIRSQLMPVNNLEPMAKLREALLAYPLRNCQFFMIEYVLIPGMNDAAKHAREVAEYLRPLRCVLNVIPHNPRPGSPWPAPSEEGVERFIFEAENAGQRCTRRITKGRGQMAACGQLGNRKLTRR
jgi:23S rRNA (adenine2503-C2)-methyltransferase